MDCTSEDALTKKMDFSKHTFQYTYQPYYLRVDMGVKQLLYQQ